MRLLNYLSLFALAGVVAPARAGEQTNVWPFWVEQAPSDSGQAGLSWSALGPLFFSQPRPASGPGDTTHWAQGFRPIFTETLDAQGHVVAGYGLYPLVTYRRMTNGYRWSIFELINHYSVDDGPGFAKQQGFDLWPFYFSRDTGNPETSYHAVLPIYGTVKGRFSQDRLTWVLFPFYARWERNNVVTTTAPWPFIKVLQGEGNHGFEFWPLFGYRAKEGAYREQFYLWPLIYKAETQLWESQPDVRLGFLPFYARTVTPDVRSEQYLWPFFGYFDRTAPYRYHETDYFWPLFVQGRGDNRYVNRWAPFYTHSVIKGVDKTWYLWPLWKQESSDEGAVRETRRRLFFFIYADTEQRSIRNPTTAPARKTHVWPLLSYWDNGAGRKQVQALSPFEVFFSENEGMRLSWAPLFAVYRYNRESPDHVRHSVLWDLVSYRRDNAAREFHLGPLFSSERDEAGKRYALGNGLIAWQREAGSGWRFSFFDFKRRQAHRPAGSPAP